MSPISRRLAAALLAASVSVLVPGAGCANKSPSSHSGASASTRQRQASARAAQRPPTTSESEAQADSCEARLHDISGLLLLYFALNKQLPQSLEELAPLAEVDTELRLTCPATGQPYVYVPGYGLGAAGTNQRLVVYEQSAAHRGLRWVVVIAPPPQPGQPPSTRVIPFSEQRFRSYFSN